jgi:hypothetical protein
MIVCFSYDWPPAIDSSRYGHTINVKHLNPVYAKTERNLGIDLGSDLLIYLLSSHCFHRWARSLALHSANTRFQYVVELASYKFTRNIFPNTVYKKAF